MEVYLLRHGDAEPAPEGGSDTERSLTGIGRHDVRRVVSAAKIAHVCPSLILSSPYKRALETAQLAADLLDYKGRIRTATSLVPDSSPPALWDEIRGVRDETCVLLAGHEPLFSAASAYLLGAPDLRIDFPKAGLIRIDLDAFPSEPHGVLRWMLSPALTI